jgi:hypothetical protein
MAGAISEPTTMPAELQKLIVLHVAFVLFLCAAQAAGGLAWRGATAAVTVASAHSN